MTINPRIWEFPTLPISGQLFHVPGAAVQGGLTSGGARIISPEPGGFAVLEIQMALQIREWEYPSASWLMSKLNGQIFRARLAPTPQVAWSARRNASGVLWDSDLLWSNQQAWEGDFSAIYSATALEGTAEVTVDMTGVTGAVQAGHVIGHGNACYIVDEIEYDGDVATMALNPPLRRDIAINDAAPLRPWFLGRVGNAPEVLSMYESANNGTIQLGKIILNEAIEP